MDRVDQEYMEEIMKSADSSDGPSGSKHTVSVKDDGTTVEDIEVKFATWSFALHWHIALWKKVFIIISVENILSVFFVNEKF